MVSILLSTYVNFQTSITAVHVPQQVMQTIAQEKITGFLRYLQCGAHQKFQVLSPTTTTT